MGRNDVLHSPAAQGWNSSMTEDQIRAVLDSLITEHGGSTFVEDYYAPAEALEHIVGIVSAASGTSLAGMMSYTFQDLRNAF